MRGARQMLELPYAIAALGDGVCRGVLNELAVTAGS